MVWSIFRAHRSVSSPARRRFVPALETLEDRTVLSSAAASSIGVFDPNTANWQIRATSTGTTNAAQFQYGMPGWSPLMGDWKGTGKTGIGVFDPQSATWYLRSETSSGTPDAGQFQYGAPGW